MAKKKKIRKNVVKGIAYVKASFNNTIITITDVQGSTQGHAFCGLAGRGEGGGEGQAHGYAGG